MNDEIKTQELMEIMPANLGDDRHLSNATIEEKSIDAILGQRESIENEQKERKDVDDDRKSSEGGDDNAGRERRAQDHEDGSKDRKEETKAGTEKAQASDQDDSKGSRTGAVEEDESHSFNKAQKLEEELRRNKKWGHDLARKLKSYQGKLEAYVEEGKLTLEEAKDLYAETMHEDPSQEESLYDGYARIWDSEINNIRKYAPEENLDKHIMGFQAKMKMSSQEEIEKTFKSFSQEEDPVKLTRQMLKEGASYYDKVLSKIEPHGGIEQYITHMEKAIEKANSKVDALKQEVVDLKSEGYLSGAGYSIPSHGRERDKGQYQKDMALESVFERARQGRI